LFLWFSLLCDRSWIPSQSICTPTKFSHLARKRDWRLERKGGQEGGG